MWDPAILACSLAAPHPFKSPLNCDAQSWLGSHSWWSSQSLLPPDASCVQWSNFLVPRALLPLTFIVSYAETMGHSAWTSKTCESGSESSCMHVQTSMANSIVFGLWFQPKQLQKWSKKCFKIDVWQFARCANGSLNLRNVAGDFYDKGIRKMPQCMQKCIDWNGDYAKK